MKVCLYLEFYNFLGGILFKNVGTGLLSSYKNQKKALDKLGIKYTEKWDNSCDILQINTPWLKSIWLIKKAKKLGKKVIIWSHVTAEDAEQVFRFNKYLFPLIKKYLTYAYGLADIVFCPTEYTKSLLVAYGLPESKLLVQSNGVDTSFFKKDDKKREDARKKYGFNEKIIGTVGLVIPRKGVDRFIDLAKKFPEYKFVWFGKIYSQILAKSLPKELPKNVTFTGYVDDIVASYNALDIFLFLSYEENQGMAILEAASVELPILVSEIPAYKGWLKNSENCLMAKSNDELETYLGKMVKNDNGIIDTLKEGAKRLANKESIETSNKNLIMVYNSLLGKQS